MIRFCARCEDEIPHGSLILERYISGVLWEIFCQPCARSYMVECGRVPTKDA